MRSPLLGLIFSLPALAAPRPVSQAVGMVTDVQGRVPVEAGEPLGITMEIHAGVPLLLERGNRVSVLLYGNGAQVRLIGPGRFTFDDKGVPHGPAQGIQRLQGPDLVLHEALKPGGLAQASLVMREPADLILLHPAQPAVRAARPVFRWEPVRGAGSYTFTLQGPDGRTCFTTQVTATTLALPASVRLESGQTYRWTLTADLPGVRPLSASGELTRLRPDQIHALERLQREAKRGFRERFLYAATLQSWGLTAEAKAEWRELTMRHPGDPILEGLAR